MNGLGLIFRQFLITYLKYRQMSFSDEEYELNHEIFETLQLQSVQAIIEH